MIIHKRQIGIRVSRRFVSDFNQTGSLALSHKTTLPIIIRRVRAQFSMLYLVKYETKQPRVRSLVTLRNHYTGYALGHLNEPAMDRLLSILFVHFDTLRCHSHLSILLPTVGNLHLKGMSLSNTLKAVPCGTPLF